MTALKKATPKYNICIVQFAHSMAWWELAEIICFSLRDLGFEAQIQQHKVEASCTNILLGAFLLKPDLIKKIPANSIFFNTEQLTLDDQTAIWPSDIYEWARNFETWDYSDRNIEKFRSLGIHNVKKFTLGYQPELTRIKKAPIQDIDVFFYGSVGERRKVIVNRLREAGLAVTAIFNIYGKERDALISRSKVILNCHHYNSQIFEVVRVFYCLTNSKAVVGEVNNTTGIDSLYLQCIKPAPYENLVEACKFLVTNDEARLDLENKAFNLFSQVKQIEHTAKLLGLS